MEGSGHDMQTMRTSLENHDRPEAGACIRRIRAAAGMAACLAVLSSAAPLARAGGGIPLTGVELGTPGAAGSETCDAGVYTITGAGTGAFAGFTGTSGDEGHFSYLTLSGDIEIVARVVAFGGGAGAQLGLMLRESTAPEANIAAALVQLPAQPSDDATFYNVFRRPSTHQIDNWSAQPGWYPTTAPLDPPYWLKLVRVGDGYSTYRSSDGLRWCPLSNYGGGAFTASGNFLAGFFVSGGANATSASATIDSLYVGPPRLEYRTSWVGNTYSDDAERWVSGIAALWVHSDGRCYTNTYYDEAGEATRIYAADGSIQDTILGKNFGGGGVSEGSVTGDGSFVYVAGRHVVDTIERVSLDGSTSDPVTLTSSIDHIGGLATGNGELYVSDVDSDRILVASLASLTETASFPFTRPGPIAVDSRGDLWVIQRATDYPNSGQFQAVYPAAVRCLQPDGTFTGREITDVVNPAAVCIDPNEDRLLVCENGTDQNIRIYTALATAPAHTSSFGVVGGLFGGGVPGLLDDAGSGGFTRLYGPSAVGIDGSGNLYVDCRTTGGFHLRKFDAGGALLWSRSALPFTQCPDFDPETDGEDLYWANAHLQLDLAQTAPGSEWSYTGLSWNPFGPDPVERPVFAGSVVRRFGPANDRYLFTAPNDATIRVYRYDSEQALPCARLTFTCGCTPSGCGGDVFWIDMDENALETPAELFGPRTVGCERESQAIDVDASGNLYVLRGAFVADAAGRGLIQRYPLLGMTSGGVPVWGVASGQYTEERVPSEILFPQRLRYDDTNDVMYVLGNDSPFQAGTYLLARWDDWSQPTRSRRYLRTLPSPADDPNFLYFTWPPEIPFNYMAMDAVGDKVFLGELWGPVHVFDGALGNEIARLISGPEVSGIMAFTDIWAGLRAFQRANGEFLVVREDAGYRSRNPLFRWAPEASTPPTTPSNLSAEGGSNAIRLTWDGGYGLTRTYSLWRGSASGAETLLADDLTAPTYEDTAVQFGAPYYYYVTASNESGTSGPSNEIVASAHTSARFGREDTETQGNWHGAYGSQGYVIVGDSQSFSPGIEFSITGHSPPFPPEVFVWASATNQIRALQRGSGPGRIAATWHGSDLVNPPKTTIDLEFTDGQPRNVALYFLDWDSTNKRAVQIDVFDSLGRLLDTRTVRRYRPGTYALWEMSGHVRVQFTDVGGFGLGASGLFVDPFVKPDKIRRRD